MREAQGGRDYRTVRWDKSPHVGHLRKHKQQYPGHVLNFLQDKYFSLDVEHEAKAWEGKWRVQKQEEVDDFHSESSAGTKRHGYSSVSF